MPKIANSLGYNGDMQGFQQYLDQNKDKQDMMNQYMQKAQKKEETLPWCARENTKL